MKQIIAVISGIFLIASLREEDLSERILTLLKENPL